MTPKSLLVERGLVDRAKSRVAHWFDSTDEPASLRLKLLKGVESIARELPNRPDWYEVRTVRWSRLFEQIFRVDKWSPLPGLGRRAERQLG
jgi:hypothetical protein